MNIVQLQVTRAGQEEDLYININCITHFHPVKDERTALYVSNKEQAITVNHSIEELLSLLDDADMDSGSEDKQASDNQ